jgi:hypothetical protein
MNKRRPSLEEEEEKERRVANASLCFLKATTSKHQYSLVVEWSNNESGMLILYMITTYYITLVVDNYDAI